MAADASGSAASDLWNNHSAMSQANYARSFTADSGDFTLSSGSAGSASQATMTRADAASQPAITSSASDATVARVAGAGPANSSAAASAAAPAGGLASAMTSDSSGSTASGLWGRHTEMSQNNYANTFMTDSLGFTLLSSTTGAESQAATLDADAFAKTKTAGVLSGSATVPAALAGVASATLDLKAGVQAEGRQQRGRSEELEEPQDKEEFLLHLSRNSYSAVVTAVLGRREAMFDVAFPLFLHVINLAVQFYLLALLFVYVTERREDSFEPDTDLVQETAVLREVMRADPPRLLNVSVPLELATEQLCDKMHIVSAGIYVALITWWLSLLPEISATCWSCYVFLSLPTREGEPMDKPLVVTSVSSSQKALLLCFVYLPKFVIAICLLGAGSKFLIFSTAIGPLLLSGATLGFIVKCGNFLFDAFAPRPLRDAVGETVIQDKTVNVLRQRLKMGETGEQYWLFVFKIGGIAMVTCTLVSVVYATVHDFKHQCNLYHWYHIPRLCDNCGLHTWFGVFNI